MDFTVDYYRVQTPEGTTFVDALEECSLYERFSEELRLFGLGNFIRLEQLSHDGACWEGDLVRSIMDRTAMRVPMEAPTRPIKLGEDEGLGKQVAFLYDSDLSVLALQKNRRGATPSRFAQYFNRFMGTSGKVELHPILSRQAMENFDEMARHTKLHIKVAGGHRGEVGTGNTSFQRMMQVAEDMGSPNLKMTLSVGRQWRDEQLNGGAVRSFVQDVIKKFTGDDEPEAEVEKIVIDGRNPNEEKIEVDLIEDRMTDSAGMPTNDDRAPAYALRRKLIEQFFNNRRSELESMFGR